LSEYEIECYGLAKATVYGEMEIEGRWNGGCGVDVYYAGKCVDYFSQTERIKDLDELQELFEEYITNWLKENEDKDEEIS